MGFLQPTIKTSVTQGKSSEFGITESRYGEPIARGYGVDRFNGNCIWASSIREEKQVQTTRSGGKGGGPKTRTTTTTYTYFTDFAVAFAEGPAEELLRIWADGKIIYDRYAESQLRPVKWGDFDFNAGAFYPGALRNIFIGFNETHNYQYQSTIDGLVFRFYKGTEDQLPDPLLELRIGENRTPAHRGLAYIVFENFNLSKFGNRIPAITAEIAFSANRVGEVQETDVSQLGTTEEGGFHTSSVIVDQEQRRAYLYVELPATIQKRFVAVDLNTLTKISQWEPENVSVTPYGIANSGALIIQPVTSSLGRDMQLADGVDGSLQKLVRPGCRIRSACGLPNVTEEIIFIAKLDDVFSEEGFVLVNYTTSPVYTSPTFLTADIIDELDAAGGEVAESVCAAGDGEAYGLIRGSSALKIYKANQTGITLEGTVTPSEVNVGATSFVSKLDFCRMAWNPSNDELIVSCRTDVGYHVFCWTGSSVRWSVDVPFNFATSEVGGTQLVTGKYIASGNDQRIVMIDVEEGVVLPEFDGQTQFGNLNEYVEPRTQWWDEVSQSIFGGNDVPGLPPTGYFQWQFAVDVGGLFNPRAAILDLCTKAGLLPSEVDVTALPSAVEGLKSLFIDRREPYKDSVEQLTQLLGYSSYEVDDKIRFSPRGTSSVLTVTLDDLVVTADTDGEAYVTTSVRERDLPSYFEVSYRDFGNAYQDSVQRAARPAAPISAVLADQPRGYEYTGAAQAPLINAIATRDLYTIWAERQGLTFRLPQRFLRMTPADVITVDLGDFTVVGRVKRADIGADFTVDSDVATEVDGQYDVEGVEGSGGNSGVQYPILKTSSSNAYLLNLPLLVDTDSVGQEASLFYWVANGLPLWPGAKLYRAPAEGAGNVQDLGTLTQPVTFGVAPAALADAPTVTRWDNETVFDVEVAYDPDSVSSVTDAEVLAGFNAAAVVKSDGEVEIIQFANAELQPDGYTVRLSRLLRGRRGTETQATGHGSDELVVFLESLTIETVANAVSLIGSEQRYVHPTIGQLFEEASEQNFTMTGTDLKPYDPVHIKAVEDGGDVDLTWVRRTRIGGEMTDLVDVPLSEQAESYEVDVRASPSDPVVRTLTSTTQSVTYTAAQIASDFGTLPSTLTFDVYQLSAVVGRGRRGTLVANF